MKLNRVIATTIVGYIYVKTIGIGTELMFWNLKLSQVYNSLTKDSTVAKLVFVKLCEKMQTKYIVQFSSHNFGQQFLSNVLVYKCLNEFWRL